MRKIMTAVAVLALAGCGGGGGSSAPASPQTQPTQTPTGPQSNYVRPQFVIRVPPRTSSHSRAPKYVSSAVQSIEITLTADSAGITTTSISGNPAETDINGSSCASGCTVNGPPSPPGTDSFKVVTYDSTGGSSGTGQAVNAGQLNSVTITAGTNNTETLTLGAIPATLAIAAPATKTAGTTDQVQSLTVTAADAGGVTIPTGQTPPVAFVDSTGALLSVTVSDPDTSSSGTCVSSDGSSACSGTASSVTMSGPDSAVKLRYDGVAENAVTLTASASTASSATATFQPTLNAPQANLAQATPAPVAQSTGAEIDLFATTGLGSTGTEYFTESGWTDYGHALGFANTGSCTSGSGLATSMSQIATISAGTNSTTNGTPISATAVSSPTAGSCPSTISDGLTSNTTDGNATLTVTYTTSSVHGSGIQHRVK